VCDIIYELSLNFVILMHETYRVKLVKKVIALFL